jgi:hypothetical protein
MCWSDTMLYCVFYFIFQLCVEATPCCICFLFYFSAMGWSDTMLYCVFYFIFQLYVEVTPCCILFSILFFSYVLKRHHVVFVFYFIFQLWVEVTPCMCFLFYISAIGWSDTMLYLFSILYFSYGLKRNHVVFSLRWTSYVNCDNG